MVPNTNIQTTGIDEATYPESFSMEQFASIRTFKGRMDYCNQRLQKLGAGSGRVVYAIDNDTVLKLAKNAKGIAQNQAEAGDWYLRSMALFPEIYDCSDDYQWIEMQRCVPAKKSDFKRITGDPFELYCQFIRWQLSRYSRRPIWSVSQDAIDYFNKIGESDDYCDTLYYDIADYMGNYQPTAIGDLLRISSWGIVRDDDGQERLVILDYGLSDDVYDQYYKPKNVNW